MNKTIYKGDDVIARSPGDIRIIEGYSGAYCRCGYMLHIKTPKIKAFHPIECPHCKHIVNLFCGEEGEKLSIEDVRKLIPIGEWG